MMTIAMMLAAAQVPISERLDALRWRSFVRPAAFAQPRGAGRIGELERTVRLLPHVRPLRQGEGIGGPSGL